VRSSAIGSTPFFGVSLSVRSLCVITIGVDTEVIALCLACCKLSACDLTTLPDANQTWNVYGANTSSTVPSIQKLLDLDAKIPAISQETCNNGFYSSKMTYLDAALLRFCYF
jgi:hypothetical protein